MSPDLRTISNLDPANENCAGVCDHTVAEARVVCSALAAYAEGDILENGDFIADHNALADDDTDGMRQIQRMPDLALRRDITAHLAVR